MFKKLLRTLGLFDVTKRIYYKVFKTNKRVVSSGAIKSHSSKVSSAPQYSLITRISMNMFSKESIDSVIYFSDGIEKIYQLKQWLSTVEVISHSVNFTILVRSYKVYELLLSEEIPLDIRYIHTIDDLMAFYEKKNIKSVLYVNNGYKNFQSLIYNKAYHVHINHGESEKSCMYSNQAKAYDFVFTAGTAGTDRYKKHLLRCPVDNFIEIGRPQIEFITDSQTELEQDRIKVMYAPTWAATHESMNYSSIAKYGEELVAKILNDERYQLVYKPHPAVGTTCSKERQAHLNIIEQIEENEFAIYDTTETTESFFNIVDIAIFDNTSVAIDYLSYDKPFLVTDFFNAGIPKFVEGGYLLEDKDYQSIDTIIYSQISDDNLSEARQTIRDYYLSNIGSATTTMIAKLVELNEEISSQ
ncbi:CDP-glycerol glycerophosphotransferase family protein [Shewanella olleyana]|uniref:CDP-glycerol glycerophosphotransferase family protein n=1 Tax=Shewanella olleyana TaxID=135626 RepID=UPI00200E41FC|nr:CDP-glycerol glycerophosphotransferase family protein [Shewanella olleyana]MCL1067022.1 CDP-glycerol glycerophosphotransferase family protein [Shewanella olleyana]